MELGGIVIAILWFFVSWQLLANFTEEREALPIGRRILLELTLMIFALVFFAAELLEILVDEIIGDEDDGGGWVD